MLAGKYDGERICISGSGAGRSERRGRGRTGFLCEKKDADLSIGNPYCRILKHQVNYI